MICDRLWTYVRAGVAAAVVAYPTLISISPGQAAFPSQNGYKVFEQNDEIYLDKGFASGGGDSSVSAITDNSVPDYFPDLSPDSTRVAFVSERASGAEIYSALTSGKGVTRLTDSAGVNYSPDWSPDGTRIVFASDRSGQFDIYVMKADGSGLKRLTSSAGSDINPVFSPDGSKIAFISGRDGNNEIYVMGADGSAVTNLSQTVIDELMPDWSPDGAMLTYSAFVLVDPQPEPAPEQPAGNWEVFTMSSAGGSAQQLTESSPDSDLNPVYSPDGTKILFDSAHAGPRILYTLNVDGTDVQLYREGAYADWGGPRVDPGIITFDANRAGNFDIYSMTGIGTKIVRLTSAASNDRWASRMPGGTKIAFTRNDDIWLMDSDGSSQKKLTDGTGRSMYPNWSPDGTKIVFQRFMHGQWDVYYMRSDGTRLTRVTFTERWEEDPAFSADGQRIVYRRFLESLPRNWDLFSIKLDSTDERNLTSSGSRDEFHPEYSPDGQQISYYSYFDDQSPRELYVMDSDGTDVQRLTNNSVGDVDPSWSPDGRKLVFVRKVGGHWHVHTYDLVSGAVLRLTDGDDDHFNPSWRTGN